MGLLALRVNSPEIVDSADLHWPGFGVSAVRALAGGGVAIGRCRGCLGVTDIVRRLAWLALRRVVPESGLRQRQTERDGPDSEGAPNARRPRAMPRLLRGRGWCPSRRCRRSCAVRADRLLCRAALFEGGKKAAGFPCEPILSGKSRKGLRPDPRRDV